MEQSLKIQLKMKMMVDALQTTPVSFYISFECNIWLEERREYFFKNHWMNERIDFSYGTKLLFKKKEKMEILFNLKSASRCTRVSRCRKSSSYSVKKLSKSDLTLFPSNECGTQESNNTAHWLPFEICRKAQLSLMDDVCNAVLKCYENHMVSHLTVLPQPIALQLLFDVRFVCALLLARDNKVIDNVTWNQLNGLMHRLFE